MVLSMPESQRRRVYRSLKFISTYETFYLEVYSGSKDRQQGGNAVDGQESEAVLVDTQHHLQAARHRLDVVVVLRNMLYSFQIHCGFYLGNSRRRNPVY